MLAYMLLDSYYIISRLCTDVIDVVNLKHGVASFVIGRNTLECFTQVFTKTHKRVTNIVDTSVQTSSDSMHCIAQVVISTKSGGKGISLAWFLLHISCMFHGISWCTCPTCSYFAAGGGEWWAFCHRAGPQQRVHMNQNFSLHLLESVKARKFFDKIPCKSDDCRAFETIHLNHMLRGCHSKNWNPNTAPRRKIWNDADRPTGCPDGEEADGPATRRYLAYVFRCTFCQVVYAHILVIPFKMFETFEFTA